MSDIYSFNHKCDRCNHQSRVTFQAGVYRGDIMYSTLLCRICIGDVPPGIITFKSSPSELYEFEQLVNRYREKKDLRPADLVSNNKYIKRFVRENCHGRT